jgi:hypothetical protein
LNCDCNVEPLQLGQNNRASICFAFWGRFVQLYRMGLFWPSIDSIFSKTNGSFPIRFGRKPPIRNGGNVIQWGGGEAPAKTARQHTMPAHGAWAARGVGSAPLVKVQILPRLAGLPAQRLLALVLLVQRVCVRGQIGERIPRAAVRAGGALGAQGGVRGSPRAGRPRGVLGCVERGCVPPLTPIQQETSWDVN